MAEVSLSESKKSSGKLENPDLNPTYRRVNKLEQTMKKIYLIMVLVLTASVAFADQSTSKAQIYYPQGSQKSFAGPADLFTGDVKVDLLFPANNETSFSGAYVTFQPGARTNWHWHPAGQHMIVTDGIALTGTRDGKVIEFKEGETVWCPSETDHWHGATPDAPMTHLVISGVKDGKAVFWKEKVTEEQYMKK